MAGADHGRLLTFEQHCGDNSTSCLSNQQSSLPSSTKLSRQPLSLEFLSDLQYLAEHHPHALARIESRAHEAVARLKTGTWHALLCGIATQLLTYAG